MGKIKLLELFGGIGACSKALERLGVDDEIVDYVEIDSFAVTSFNAMHGTNFEPQDITKWDKDVEVDLIMHGSPCQDFSIAGLNKGGDEGSGTRSSLMYETLRIVSKLKPKYVVWENVKNLLSTKHRANFDAYQKAMEDLGYKNFYKVLNAKDYGIPQNRERVFTVSILDGGDFEFPESQPLGKRLADVLEEDVDKKYYISADRVKGILESNFVQERTRIQTGGVCSTVLARDWKDPKCVVVVDDIYKNRPPRFYTDTAPTLRAFHAGDLKTFGEGEQVRVRKLTPKECWRLMGFDDSDFEKAVATRNSNTQLYKQAGNSIVVNVLEAVLRKLLW